jgi:hypothetical protein
VNDMRWDGRIICIDSRSWWLEETRGKIRTRIPNLGIARKMDFALRFRSALFHEGCGGVMASCRERQEID